MKTCPSCEEQNSPNARFCQACGSALPDIESPAPEVRKTISVVACQPNLLALTTEDAEADEISRLEDAIKRILDRHGGTVVDATHESILVVFGVPLTHEDDALRAVKVAYELKFAIGVLHDDRSDREPCLGIDTGEGIVAGARASGAVVDSAITLSRSIPAGQIWLSESTHRLVRDAVTVEAIGSGVSLPSPAHRLIEVRQGAVMGVLRNLGSELVGRAGEMRLLKQLFAQAVAEQTCRLVTLFGPAGVGKTRLAAEFARWAGDRAHVMQGPCLPYGEAITFWPIAEALRGFIGIDNEATEQEALERVHSLVAGDEHAELISERVTAMMGLSAATPSTQETFWAVRKLLEHVAAERPLILMLDDIHWAEPTLLDLIEHVAGFDATSPILLLCQSRNELIEARPSWGTASEAIPVDPLSDEQVRALIDQLLGDVNLPEPVSRKIRRAAEGNPLYVEEILRMFLDEGILAQDPEGLRITGSTDSVAIPPTIQALVAARLDRLEPDGLAVLQAASVVGRTFWGGALSDLVPESLRPRLAHHLQDLVRKELVFPDRSTFAGEDAYRFGHILVRDATYEAIPEHLRADMHERFGRWLEAKAGDRLREYEEILGFHLEQAYKLQKDAALPDAARALAERAWTILVSAGRRAFSRADMPAAASFLRRSSELLPPEDARRLEISTDLAIALGETGDFKAAVNVLDEAASVADAVGDEAASGRAAIQRCFIQLKTGEEGHADEFRALASRLIPRFASLNDELGQTRAYRLLATIDWSRYNFAATEHSLEQALMHARRASTAHDEAAILTALASAAFWGPTRVHDAIERCEEMLSSARDNHVLVAKIQLRLAGLKAMDGDFSQARRLLSRSRATLGEFGLDYEVAASTQEAGLIELLAGDLEAAEREFRSGHDSLLAMGEAWYLSTAAALLARTLYLRDELDEAERFADTAADLSGNDPMYQTEWAPTKARILARKGRHAEALDLARDTVRIAMETDDVVLQGDALVALADVLRASGDDSEAQDSLSHALELYEAKGVLPWVERTMESLNA